MNKVKGDLIKLAMEGEFDLIVHGCAHSSLTDPTIPEY